MSAQLQRIAKSSPESSVTAVQAGKIQRKQRRENEHDEDCPKCRKGLLNLQRSSTNMAEPSSVPQVVHEVLNSPDRPLNVQTRPFMEPHFGHDFSKIRVYVYAMNYPVDHVQFIQRTMGSQVVDRLINSSALQAKLRIGQPEDIYEQEADRVAEQVMQIPVPMPPFEISRLPNPSIDIVQRTYEPPKSGPTLSPAQLRGTKRFHELDDIMRRWRHTYTQQTWDVTFQLEAAMNIREVYVESLQLDPDAEKRIQSITDLFFVKLKQELARKPQEDPNQEGNILAIWRKWDAAFSNQLVIEQLRQGVIDTEEPEEPGDYPQPENPLDFPHDKEEMDRIA